MYDNPCKMNQIDIQCNLHTSIIIYDNPCKMNQNEMQVQFCQILDGLSTFGRRGHASRDHGLGDGRPVPPLLGIGVHMEPREIP